MKLKTAKGADCDDAAAEEASLNTSDISNLNLKSESKRGNVEVSYLVSVSLGIFVDFCQGQVGVEFISVFLQDGKQAVISDSISNVKK